MSRLKPIPADIEKHIASLEETTRRLTACTTKVSKQYINVSLDGKQWSPVEILAHLRACDDLWSHSIYAMLAQANPALPDLDERRWAKTTRLGTLDFKQSLRAFALQRAEFLRVVRELPEEAWARTCTMSGRAHSVFSQVRRLVLHEADHCQQIEAIIAKLK